MELEITKTIYINIDIILDYIKEGNLTPEIAVDCYVRELDDDEYYLIGDEETKKIIKKVEKMLDK